MKKEQLLLQKKEEVRKIESQLDRIEAENRELEKQIQLDKQVLGDKQEKWKELKRIEEEIKQQARNISVKKQQQESNQHRYSSQFNQMSVGYTDMNADTRNPNSLMIEDSGPMFGS